MLLLFFSSSAMLRERCFVTEPRPRCFVKEIRNRNIAIETTKTNNSREPRARASCKHSATVHPARLRAPTPHRSIRIESPYRTQNRSFNSSRDRPAFPGERLQNALDVRRNASRGRNCGRFLLRHDF